MSQAVFHLGVTEADLNGATLAIIPGDPARVQKIAEEMENPVFLASHREYTLYRAELDGKPVVVCSTGIGAFIYFYCSRRASATWCSYFPTCWYYWRNPTTRKRR